MNEQQAYSLLHVAYWIWTSQLSYQLVKFEMVQYFYLHTQHVCKVKAASHLSCTLPRQRQFGSACRKKSFVVVVAQQNESPCFVKQFKKNYRRVFQSQQTTFYSHMKTLIEFFNQSMLLLVIGEIDYLTQHNNTYYCYTVCDYSNYGKYH